jgi:hypothetical protein
MLRILVIAAAFVAAVITTPARAQELVESYTAYPSEADHFNSNGQRLTSAAAIIRQDRANFHRFGRGNPGDEGDRFFASIDSRAAMERMLERGRSSPAAINAIVNRTPLIRVDIYRDGDGHFIGVTVLN